MKDADVYVDYNNTGVAAEYKKYSSVKQFTSMRLVDKSDSDMSGAVIFATVPGTGTSGTPVNLAAAWGQNPDVSLMVSQVYVHRASGGLRRHCLTDVFSTLLHI